MIQYRINYWPDPNLSPMVLCRCEVWVRPESDGTCRWCKREVEEVEP